jgi:hypothetical protein
MSDRWKFVGEGPLGYVWHDRFYNRYVLSDQHGPGAVIGDARRGARFHEHERVKFEQPQEQEQA